MANSWKLTYLDHHGGFHLLDAAGGHDGLRQGDGLRAHGREIVPRLPENEHVGVGKQGTGRTQHRHSIEKKNMIGRQEKGRGNEREKSGGGGGGRGRRENRETLRYKNTANSFTPCTISHFCCVQ